MSWIATHRRQLDQWPNDAEDVLQLARLPRDFEEFQSKAEEVVDLDE